MGTPHRDITAYLARLRRALNRVALLEAACVALIATGVAGVVGLLMAPAVGRVSALVTIGLGVAVAGAAVWYLWWRPRRARGTDDAVALYVEGRVPDLHSSVISAVQTERLMRIEPNGGHLGFAPALALATARRAATALRRHPPRGLVSADRLRALSVAAFTVSAAVIASVTLAPHYVLAGWSALSAPTETIDGPAGRLVDVAVGDFSLELTPPAYLRMETRKEVSSSGAIRAVRGSEVRYVASLLEPAKAVVLILESQPEARWSVTLRDGGVIEGRVRIGDDDRYQFVVALDDGTLVRERTWRTIRSVPDGIPTARMLLPESDLEVHHGDEVPLLFEASDDFGLSVVDLVVVGPDGDERLRRSVKQPQGGRTARGTTSLAVASLELEPGQSAEVYFEATDVNTQTGPGVAKSASRTLTMYSPEREHDVLMTQLQRLIDGLVGVIADRLESPVEDRHAAKLYEYVSTQSAISRKEALALEALEKLMVALRTDPLSDEEFRSGLKRAYDGLKGAHDQEVAQLAKTVSPDVVTPRPPVLVQLLFTANEDTSLALESTIFELKHLLDRARQDKILQHGREMLEVQNQLRELMEQVKKGDRAAIPKALAKIARLQAKLRKMQREMMKMAERVPYENQNMSSRPAGELADAKSMEDQMAHIERLLREGKVDEAMKLLEALNRDTQELMAGLQSDFRRVQVTAKGRKKLNEFQEKMGKVADGQRGLSAETGEEQRRLDRARQGELRQALDGARQEARAIRDTLRGVDRGALHPADKKALEALEGSAKGLQTQLQMLDTEGAQSTAEELAGGSAGLAKEVGEGASRERRASTLERMEAAQERLGKAAAAARRLAAGLARFTRERGEGAGGEQSAGGDRGGGGDKPSAGMKRLSKRQGKLSKRLDGLRDALDELDKEVPGLRDTLKPDLDKAEKSMESAAKRLGKGRSRAARAQQGEAQERLDSAMKALEDALKRQRGKSGDRPGPNSTADRVGIPEERHSPKAFREELLKAMKERAPKRYKSRIDRYYKELVR